MFLENDLSLTLALDGEWDFRLGAAPARSLPVPSAWEAHVPDKVTDGPAIYSRQFEVVESWLAAARIVLEADAISFDCVVRVNGQEAGRHRGLWSPFQIDITSLVRAGDNGLEIEVWKPGRRFPVRECLAGFLPDVATTFGGIWQGIRLRVFSWAALADLRTYTYGGGWLDVQGRIVGLGERRRHEVVVEVFDALDLPVAKVRGEVSDAGSFAAHLEAGQVENWAPLADSALYSVRISLLARDAEIARATRRVGFRDVDVDADRILLNAAPTHLRGVLDWGWNPERIAPTLTRDELLDNFAKARSLGFNLFKLCLFVPDETTFSVADEVGMMLWLEMPLWLPNLTPEARDHALSEYRDLFQRLHHHPSIVVVSLGCELNAQANADFLTTLDSLAREFFPSALHCDNSGSAEAYGGVATSLSDFYDYHFYTDPHFFRPLVQHFSRPYLPAKPWLYGEFCDADTLRDYARLDPHTWWLAQPTSLERDDFLATRDFAERLRRAGLTDGGAALTNLARWQATAVRKFILEQVRAHSASGGYVLTGWKDTPITTSGVVDDGRNLKFSSAEWRQFNAARALIIDRERRRQWTGGDRPLQKDPHVWHCGDRAEIHLMLANGDEVVENGHLSWRLMPLTGPALAGGEGVVTVPGGALHELAVISARMPQADTLVELRLLATLKDTADGRILSQNSWKLWAVPRISEPIDTGRRLLTEIDENAVARARAGESLVVWLKQPDSRWTRSLPFWREAIHVFEQHSVWERAPHSGYADMRFFSLATDFALEAGSLAQALPPDAALTSLWRRFDARQMFWCEYLVEARIGAGRLLVTTLRFAGGLGAQPLSLDANPMGAWLLHSLLALP